MVIGLCDDVSLSSCVRASTSSEVPTDSQGTPSRVFLGVSPPTVADTSTAISASASLSVPVASYAAVAASAPSSSTSKSAPSHSKLIVADGKSTKVNQVVTKAAKAAKIAEAVEPSVNLTRNRPSLTVETLPQQQKQTQKQPLPLPPLHVFVWGKTAPAVPVSVSTPSRGSYHSRSLLRTESECNGMESQSELKQRSSISTVVQHVSGSQVCSFSPFLVDGNSQLIYIFFFKSTAVIDSF